MAYTKTKSCTASKIDQHKKLVNLVLRLRTKDVIDDTIARLSFQISTKSLCFCKIRTEQKPITTF